MHILDVVHSLDGLLGIVIVAVADEPESTAPASITVLDDNLFGVTRSPLVRLSLHRMAGARRMKGKAGDMLKQVTEPQHTASSTAPNSSNFCLRVPSSVCHAKPLWLRVSKRHLIGRIDNLGLTR